MRQILLLFLLSLLSTPCHAQLQGNVWYFGDGAGLNFNTTPPTPLTDGQTYNTWNHSEGTGAICNAAGELLFYTNGENLWNRHHALMPNGSGLLGHYSSTQGGLIVPQPGSHTRYYVFTTDGFARRQTSDSRPDGLYSGLHYSVVDLCLDNGRGDVVPQQKNILLLASAGEKLSATLHANGRDVWIVTHEIFTDAFHAFLLTSDGITSDVISHTGSYHRNAREPMSTTVSIGQMKISPDGSKLGLASGNGAPVGCELFDFDNATGIVSNGFELQESLRGNCYGAAFSPDSRKFYVTYGFSQLYQFDLTGNDRSEIRSSATVVSPPTTDVADPVSTVGMQLGPDGRIYVCTGRTFLDVIAYPNLGGRACNYTRRSVDLKGRVSVYTFPGMIDSYRYSSLGTCPTDTANESPIVASIALPTDTVPVGSPVRLPIVVRAISPTLLSRLGSLRLRVQIGWDGWGLRPDGVENALAHPVYQLDSITGRGTLTFEIGLGAENTLATILATSINGGVRSSALTFDQIKVVGASARVLGINGNVIFTGDCGTGLPFVGVRPRVEKVAPNPTDDEIMLTFDLESEGTLQSTIVSPDGLTVAVPFSPTFYRAGRHSLRLDLRSLPSGIYFLHLDAGAAPAVVPIAVAR